MRDAFIRTLTSLAERDERIYLLTGDLGFSVFEDFAAKYPSRFVNAGIAEANMTGVAAGLGKIGKKAVTYSNNTFFVLRCLEQIKLDVCYQNANVKIVGRGRGAFVRHAWVTHQSIEDIAVTRAFPNLRILWPCDPVETEACCRLAMKEKGPFYIRLGKNREPRIHTPDLSVRCGGSAVVAEGKDLVIFTSGPVISRVIAASGILPRAHKGQGVSMYSIKPVDEAVIPRVCPRARALVTVDEPSVFGG
jgi:transketolase